MPVPASKASELYKKLIEDGYTADNIGSEEEFNKKASTKEGAGKLHSVLLSEGYTEDNLGNIDEFTTKLVSVSPDKKKSIYYRAASFIRRITGWRLRIYNIYD